MRHKPFALANAAIAAALLTLTTIPALAQQAALVGVLGNKALLVIDGKAPRTVGSGESVAGIKVISVTTDSALVETEGTKHTLRLGDTPVHITLGGSGGGKQRIVLRADARGHFTNSGLINGKFMQYMVDTGATMVTISESEAMRMGIAFKSGQPTMIGTGNGNVRGYRITLDNIRAGEITVHNVEAVVLPQPMPYVLLGNSFLNAFQMSRTNDEMVLERK